MSREILMLVDALAREKCGQRSRLWRLRACACTGY